MRNTADAAGPLPRRAGTMPRGQMSGDDRRRDRGGGPPASGGRPGPARAPETRRPTMSEPRVDVIRAWKDAEYRESLSEADRAALPENPAGMTEVSDAELGDV